MLPSFGAAASASSEKGVAARPKPAAAPVRIDRDADTEEEKDGSGSDGEAAHPRPAIPGVYPCRWDAVGAACVHDVLPSVSVVDTYKPVASVVNT